MIRFSLMLAAVIALSGPLVNADDKPQVRGGENPAPRDGEKPGKQGPGDEAGIRALLKAVDLDKGVITVVISGDGGTSVRTLNLAGKDIKVTGITEKLSDLRAGVQVFLQLSADDDVLAIRTAKARPNTKTGRIFAAYDKSGDGKVNFEEWLSLKEGVDAARRAREKFYFDGADTDRDGGISFAEFENWLENRGRQPEAPRQPPVPNLVNPLPKK